MTEPGDNQPGTETSDKRVFTEVWKKETRDMASGIVLTNAVVYVGDECDITVYDTVTRQEIGEIAPGGGYNWDISQSRDGKSLFVACDDGTARIVNLGTGKDVILRGHTGDVDCIIQGEGTDVLTCSWDKTIRRWNSLTGGVFQLISTLEIVQTIGGYVM
jgi:WD40 repeat protein